MLKKPILFACLIFSQTSIANEALPPILDYQPLCSPTILNNISHYKSYPIESGSVDNKDKLNKSLLQVRQQAKTSGADAVIINNITQFMAKLKKIKARVNISIIADAIKFCEENQSLSTVNTPFDSTGNIVQSILMAFTIPVSEYQGLVQHAQDIEFVDPTVTLTSAFGVELGSTAERLLAKLGPPSAKLTLDDDAQAWIYGRNISFILASEVLVAVNYGDVPLKASGKNQIKYNPNFDDINWNILSKINYHNELSLVQDILGKSLIKKDNSSFYLQNSGNELELRFERFITAENIMPIAKLVGFSLTSNKKHQGKKQVQFMAISPTQLQALFFKSHSPLPIDRYIKLKNENTFNFTQTGQWHLLTNNILIQHNDEEIDRVKLLSGLTAEEDATSFNHLLNTLALPSTKADFMGQYPNAEDNFDSVIVSDDRVFIEAKFDSESNNAKLVELDIKYF